MMSVENNDIRWKQRFHNFENSRTQLYNACYSYQKEPFNKQLQIGLISSFEFTFKLAWKTVRDYLIYQGVRDVTFPREVIKKGFSYEIIEDGQMWINIIGDTALIEYSSNEELIGTAISHITPSYMKAVDQVYDYFRKQNKTVSKFGLSEGVLQLICDLFTQYQDIYEVKIYGSRAFGNCGYSSDIDLAFYTKSKKDVTDELQEKLDALPTPYLFDVTNYNKTRHKPLKYNIDKVSKTIYRKNQ